MLEIESRDAEIARLRAALADSEGRRADVAREIQRLTEVVQILIYTASGAIDVLEDAMRCLVVTVRRSE